MLDVTRVTKRYKTAPLVSYTYVNNSARVDISHPPKCFTLTLKIVIDGHLNCGYLSDGENI